MKKSIYPLVIIALLSIAPIVPAVLANAALTNTRFQDTGNLNIVAGGVGLQGVTEGEIALDIPNSGKSEVVAAYLYWSGYDPIDGGDDEVDFEGKTVTVLDTYGPDLWYPPHYCYVYVADVTSDVKTGNNIYTIEGVDELDRNFGAGLIAVYQSKNLPWAQVTILDGLDNFWFGWPNPRGPNSEVTALTFANSVFPRVAEVTLFAGATEHDDRPNEIWTATGTGTPDTNLITTPSIPDDDYSLVGIDGPSWDTYSTDVEIPAGDEWLGVQVESIYAEDDSGSPEYYGRGTSGVLAAAGFVLPLPVEGGKVTGGGQIPIISGGKGSFGFNAMWYSRDPAPKGELEYVDHDTGTKVHAHNLDWLEVFESNPGNKPWPMRYAFFKGPCTVDHVAGYYFECLVEDDTEPGTADRFTLVVYEIGNPSNVIIDEDATLIHGNIQIHKPPQ